MSIGGKSVQGAIDEGRTNKSIHTSIVNGDLTNGRGRSGRGIDRP